MYLYLILTFEVFDVSVNFLDLELELEALGGEVAAVTRRQGVGRGGQQVGKGGRQAATGGRGKAAGRGHVRPAVGELRRVKVG